jgi:hypothetical protein
VKCGGEKESIPKMNFTRFESRRINFFKKDTTLNNNKSAIN